MRIGSLIVVFSSVSSLVGVAHGAATMTITKATTSVSTGAGCSDACVPQIGSDCFLVCDNSNRNYVEYANTTVGITAISIDASGTADVSTLVPRASASASAHYQIDFTLDEPSFVYTTWNIFFPPSDTDFLPTMLPPEGVWVGQIPAGAHFIGGTLDVSISGLAQDLASSGLLMRVIPDYFADCDNDGTYDWQEIVNGSQTDLNNNGIPDDCEPVPNPADLNGDGVVNAADLGILLGAWQTAGPGDLNGDGIVTAADLAIMLGAWS